jgi:hypothetical protein
MSTSLAPFVVGLVFTDRLRRYSKDNMLPQWEKLFRYAQFCSALLFAVEVIFSAVYFTNWIFHAYLIWLIIFSSQQKELRVLRMFVVACIPYAVVSLVSDLAEIITSDFLIMP